MEDSDGADPRSDAATDGRGTVALPLLGGDVDPAAAIASALAEHAGVGLKVVDLATGAGSARVAMAEGALAKRRDAAREAFDASALDRDAAVGVSVGVGPTVGGAVADATAADDLVVLDAGPRDAGRGSRAERVAERVGCDAVTVRANRGFDDGVASVLVPVAGGPHSGLAADVACGVAAAHDAWVEILHVVPEDASTARRERGESYLAAAAERFDGVEADTWLLEAEDVADAVVDQTRYHDLVVLGAPRTGRLRRFVFGSTTEEVRADAATPVLTAWRNAGTAGWRPA